DGVFVGEIAQPSYPDWAYGTVTFQRPAGPGDLEIRTDPGAREAKVRVIGVRDGTLITEKRQAILSVKEGIIGADAGQDILKIAMFDRFARWEKPGVGFVQGFGLKSGALATTYNPLYENVIVVGTNDEDMALAANTLAKVGGGFLAVQDGRIKAMLELPLFGLLSDSSLEVATDKMERLYEAVREMGCQLSGPYHALAFVGVSGEMASIKIAHQGMFDVEEKQFVDTVVEAR
ncbi:MAG: hypothetical protein M1358_12870, partial [Chloroflexi bacterium]|nr:hypothetical protein [Chloroflexota bacterium]